MRLPVAKYVVLGMCLLGLWGSAAVAGPFSKPVVEWQKDIHAAHELAVREQKPMLLVFGAEWCGFCKKLEKMTLANPQMVKYINSTFVSVHVDVDKDPQVARILEVESLPCTIVLSPDADLLGRIEGFESPSVFYRKLSAAKKLQVRVSQASSGGRE